MGSDGGGAAAAAGRTMKRAEVDTRRPFQSVKEAVTLFGEKVLAGELIYSNKIKQAGSKENDQSSLGSELKETKQSLEKAKEESTIMANSISLLRQELEKTKQELRHLKLREVKLKEQSMTTIPTPQPEIDNGKDVRVVGEALRRSSSSNYRSSHDGGVEFQKKRYVTFANPPSLAQVMLPPGRGSSSSGGGGGGVVDHHHQEMLERHPSLRKKKKKPLIPLIGGFFSSKRKGHNHQVV